MDEETVTNLVHVWFLGPVRFSGGMVLLRDKKEPYKLGNWYVFEEEMVDLRNSTMLEF